MQHIIDTSRIIQDLIDTKQAELNILDEEIRQLRKTKMMVLSKVNEEQSMVNTHIG